MDINLDTRRISSALTTGIAQPLTTDMTDGSPVSSFKDILREQLGTSTVSDINFSRHAINRVVERSIDLSDENLLRLSEGVRLAEEKGLDDTLILMDSAAFIVSVKNNTVITTVSADELRGNVFTNIEGTVII